MDTNPAPKHNLPQRGFRKFIGRSAEKDTIRKTLLPHPESRHFVITIDGVGGVGKSALALEIAHYYVENYNALPEANRFDAIVWVSAKESTLTAQGIAERHEVFTNLSDLYDAIFTMTGSHGARKLDLKEQHQEVRNALARTRTLLVVDNFETIEDASLLGFLRELPDPTKAIITTRHRIDVAWPVRLGGLSPKDSTSLLTIELATHEVEIEQRFVDSLVERCGGVPLALVWTVGLLSIGHGIEATIRKLDSASSDIAEFCFGESIQSIREDSLVLLALVAFFEERVTRGLLYECSNVNREEVDELIVDLVKRSLVNADSEFVSVLPLTRRFANATVRDSRDIEESIVESIEGFVARNTWDCKTPEWQWRDLGWLAEQGNHLITIAKWAESESNVNLFLRLIPAISGYYDVSGRWGEPQELARLAKRYAQLTNDYETEIFLEAVPYAWFLGQQGAHAKAENHIRKAIRKADKHAVPYWQCEARILYSQILRAQQRFTDAEAQCLEALRFVDHLDETIQEYENADIDYERGKISRDQESWESAKMFFERSSRVFYPDDKRGIVNPERAWGLIANLGLIEFHLGNYDESFDLYEQALEFFRERGGRGYHATILLRVALVQQQRGDLSSALEYANQSLSLSLTLNLRKEIDEASSLISKLS